MDGLVRFQRGDLLNALTLRPRLNGTYVKISGVVVGNS